MQTGKAEEEQQRSRGQTLAGQQDDDILANGFRLFASSLARRHCSVEGGKRVASRYRRTNSFLDFTWSTASFFFVVALPRQLPHFSSSLVVLRQVSSHGNTRPPSCGGIEQASKMKSLNPKANEKTCLEFRRKMAVVHSLLGADSPGATAEKEKPGSWCGFRRHEHGAAAST